MVKVVDAITSLRHVIQIINARIKRNHCFPLFMAKLALTVLEASLRICCKPLCGSQCRTQHEESEKCFAYSSLNILAKYTKIS